MDKERCYFDMPGHAKYCMALSQKKCAGCSFYKTTYQARRDEERAYMMLVKKGLVPCQRDGIMTTRPLRDYEKERTQQND